MGLQSKIRLGIIGGLEKEADEVDNTIGQLISELTVDCEILTYGSDQQVSRFVSTHGAKKGLERIGIVPRKFYDKDFCDRSFDDTIIIDPQYGESMWGDEAEVFVKSCDGIYIIGGGNGTMIEYTQAMKYNESLYDGETLREGAVPKYLVSHYGLGGFSEQLYAFQPRNTAPDCFPNYYIRTATDASSFLNKVLGDLK